MLVKLSSSFLFRNRRSKICVRLCTWYPISILHRWKPCYIYLRSWSSKVKSNFWIANYKLNLLSYTNNRAKPDIIDEILWAFHERLNIYTFAYNPSFVGCNERATTRPWLSINECSAWQTTTHCFLSLQRSV